MDVGLSLCLGVSVSVSISLCLSLCACFSVSLPNFREILAGDAPTDLCPCLPLTYPDSKESLCGCGCAMEYPWEQRERLRAFERGEWQRGLDWQSFCENDMCSPDPEPEEAGKLLVECLIDLHLKGKLRANYVCMLAFFAHKAGAQGDCKHLGRAPGKQSGSYQRKVDSFLGHLDRSGLYSINVPGYDKYDVARTNRELLVANAHERLHEEFTNSLELGTRLQTMQTERALPPAYYENPVYKRWKDSGLPVFPCSLYMDGVQYGKRDAVLNITIQNIVSGRRHVIAVINRARVCRCGCRGWCTASVVYSFACER